MENIEAQQRAYRVLSIILEAEERELTDLEDTGILTVDDLKDTLIPDFPKLENIGLEDDLEIIW